MAAYEEQEYHKPFRLKVWAKMLSFFKLYKKYFAITLGLYIFLAGVDVLTPLFQSYAIDHFIVVAACTDQYTEIVCITIILIYTKANV